jgi:hypothetical protein
MKLSSNLSRGVPASMNVSKEADAGFMHELKRTDRPRYNSLIASIQQAAFRLQGTTAAATCQYSLCNGSTSHLRAGTKFCTAACKMKAARLSKAA